MKRAGRITTFAFAVGAGLLIASGAGAAVAEATPDTSGHSSSGSSTASSARTHTPAASSTSTAKPTSASIVVPNTKHATPVASTLAAATVSTVSTPPTVSAKQTPAQRLPTPAPVQQLIAAGLDATRRNLDTLRQNIELLVRHQIEGIRDNLTTLRYDLAGIVGPYRPPVTPNIPADDTPGLIGNPADKEQYFLYQGQTNRCVLMSTAMVIGQLLGIDKMPTAQEITNEAANTPSTVTPGTVIYDPAKDAYVSYADSLQLLEAHGITATSTQFSKGQGANALANLKSALVAGDSVIVTVNADIAWGDAAPGGVVPANHAITVLGINTVTNTVYVNDSAFPQDRGMGIALPLKLFMSAWQPNDYQTITAYVTPAATATVAA